MATLEERLTEMVQAIGAEFKRQRTLTGDPTTLRNAPATVAAAVQSVDDRLTELTAGLPALVSGDALNQLTRGTDDGFYVPPTDIAADLTAYYQLAKS